MDVYWHIDRRDCNEWCTEEGCYISRLAAAEERVKELELRLDKYTRTNNHANERVIELESQLMMERNKVHAARKMWCDSKRDPETGYVDIKYWDEFEKAITSDGTTGEKINNEYRGSSEEPPL
jgi:hypothetical protein